MALGSATGPGHEQIGTRLRYPAVLAVLREVVDPVAAEHLASPVVEAAAGALVRP
jgi:hypothetical protein